MWLHGDVAATNLLDYAIVDFNAYLLAKYPG